MADVETALMLRMEASLAKFEKQMARARKAGSDTAVGLEKRFANSNKKMSASAERSAQVIGREMDRLRSKYDPLYAASKRYETELEELNRAHKVGALNANQYDGALERLNSEYARSTSSAARMNTAVEQGSRRLSAGVSRQRGYQMAIQNTAYQVGDFAVQVGAGTSASMALGQQLPQMLGGFGILGAVLGAVVAIAVPLASAFFRSGEEAKTLQERIDELESAVRDYRDAVKNASLPTADLAEKYGTATKAARTFLVALREVSEFAALEKLSERLDEISTRFGTFESRALGPMQMNQGITNLGETFQKLSKELDITIEQAASLTGALEALGDAEGPKDQAEAAQRLLRAMENVLGPVSEMPAPAREFYEELANSGKEAASLQGGMDGAANSISGAASEAGRLADELARAVNNAINLSAQGISDLRKSEIELEYRDDPVGRARAMAGEQWSAQTGDLSGVDPILRQEMERQRDGFIENAVAVEENRQTLIAWKKAQAEAANESKKSRSKKEKPGLFEKSDEQMLQLERQMEMIGKTRSEVARMTAEYRLLDEARKRGLDLDARQTASGETLRQEIERQADTIGKLTEAKERATEKSQQMAQMQDQLKNGFIDAILEGENLSGVMESLAKSIAKAALQAALFGEGPFAGDSGGLLGGLFQGIFNADGNAFQGGRVTPFATGGIVSKPTAFPMAGRNVGIMGEAGPEAIMPLTRGRNGKLGVQAEGGGSQRVEIVLRAPEGFTAEQMNQVQGVAIRVTSEGISSYDRTTLPKSISRIGDDPRRRG